MTESFVLLFVCIMGIILGVMWLFLPFLIASKLDKVIEELKKLNSK